MNRRRFMGGLAAGCGIARAFGETAPPHCDFPKTPRERLAVASYPFRAELKRNGGTMKLLDFPKMVADRFGLHGIEPLDEHFPSTEPAYLKEFRNSLEASGAHVVNIPVGRLAGSFYDPGERVRNAAISDARRWIDVAAAIGSPSIRAHILPVKGVPPHAEHASGALRELASYGQQKQIVVNLENDDPASEDAFFLVDVIARANTAWLRALPDFCNSMLLNKGVEYNTRAVKAMFQHACKISHVKEVESDGGALHRVDPRRLFQISKECGYRGYYSIEWDSDGDPYAGTQHLISLSLEALASVS